MGGGAKGALGKGNGGVGGMGGGAKGAGQGKKEGMGARREEAGEGQQSVRKHTWDVASLEPSMQKLMLSAMPMTH